VLQGVLTTLQFLQHTGTMLKNTWQHLEISVETCCNMWLNTFGGSIRREDQKAMRENALFVVEFRDFDLWS